MAAFATLVSNPLTYAPILVAAYHVGAGLLDEPVDAGEVDALAEAAGGDDADLETWQQRFARIGKPLALGLALFAVGGAVLTWIAVNVLWIAAVALKRRARRGAAQ